MCSFYALRSQKRKKNSQVVSLFFAVLGSSRAKAARTVLKLTQGFNFINISQAPFSYKGVLHSFSLVTVWLCNFLAQE